MRSIKACFAAPPRSGCQPGGESASSSESSIESESAPTLRCAWNRTAPERSRRLQLDLPLPLARLVPHKTDAKTEQYGLRVRQA